MSPFPHLSFLIAVLFTVVTAFLGAPGPAPAQDGPPSQEPAHEPVHHAPAGAPAWEGSPAGKAYSEFNHHLAGVFVLLIGLSEVRSALALPRFAWTRFLLPASMVGAGLYLLIWSDHEAWPIGRMSLTETLWSDDLEILQHKLYAVLLLAVGTIEALRHLGRIRHGLWQAPLPVFAILGGLLLFLHGHGAHPAAHKIALHHAIMGTLAMSAGACKLMPGWTAGGRRTELGGGPRKTRCSRWDLVWAGLICLIGIQLLVYTE